MPKVTPAVLTPGAGAAQWGMAERSGQAIKDWVCFCVKRHQAVPNSAQMERNLLGLGQTGTI